MNKDQVTGKVEQAAGRVKQGVGETLGNQKLANQGVADQVKGAAKETWGNVKDAAAVTADRTRKKQNFTPMMPGRGSRRRSTMFMPEHQRQNRRPQGGRAE